MLNIIMQASPGTVAQSQFPFFMMLGAMFLVFYILIIRPQNKRLKEHKAKLAAVVRGDVVVTGGGLIGKVTKVTDEGELMVDLGGGNKVKVVASMLADVRSTAPANDTAKK